VLSRAAALELTELLDPQAKKNGERVEERENESAANDAAQSEATEEAA